MMMPKDATKSIAKRTLNLLLRMTSQSDNFSAITMLLAKTLGRDGLREMTPVDIMFGLVLVQMRDQEHAVAHQEHEVAGNSVLDGIPAQIWRTSALEKSKSVPMDQADQASLDEINNLFP